MRSKFERYDLTGKTALITGGAGLLGVEHALALIESGASVILTDVNQARLDQAVEILEQQGAGKRLDSVVLDVVSTESLRKASSYIFSRISRLDILVNNAAIDPKVKGGEGIVESSRLENFPLDQWELQIAVGLTGAFLCSQLFGTTMAENGKGGVILNISSDLSIFAPDQRLYRKNGLPENLQPVKPVTYSVIKSGLIGLTRYLATYWADKGVRCNALSPGGVFNGQDNDFVERLSALIPMGRMATRDEYHSAVQFLCSDASSYMNGQNVVMDGGRSVW